MPCSTTRPRAFPPTHASTFSAAAIGIGTRIMFIEIAMRGLDIGHLAERSIALDVAGDEHTVMSIPAGAVVYRCGL